jgi:beta-lactamase regulating signal transducer with metallopeptidase domain
VLVPVASRSVAPRLQFVIPELIPTQIVAKGDKRTEATPALEEERALSATEIVGVIWLVGMAFVAMRWILSWRAAAKLRRAAEASGRCTTIDGVNVIFSEDVISPVAAGLFSPVVLAPADGLDRAAMLHEAAHVRRFDAWTRLLAQIACAMYWFNPLVWACARLAQLEQECACDDEVLFAGVSPLDYADVLLHAARPTRAAVLAIGGSQMETRLRAIIDPLRRRAPLTFRRTVAAAAMMLVALTAAASVSLIAPSSFDDPQSEELPDVTLADTTRSSSADAAAIATLHELAKKPKTWRGDLVAQRARWALRTIGDGDLTAIHRALDDRDWRVRAYAAWTIAVAEDARAVPRLMELMDDPIWRMRAMAAFALAATRDPRAEAVMERATADRAWQVRHESARYFRRIDSASSARILAALAKDEHVAVRLIAAGDEQ